MREIKFRAWDKPNKRFSEYFFINAFGEIFSDCDPRGIDMSGKRRIVMSPDRYEIMQYTGLKDKNGKEIYEGDIVRMNWLKEVDDLERLKIVEKNHEKGDVYKSWNEYFDAKDECTKIEVEELVTPIIFENGMFQGVREEDQRILFYHKIQEWEVEIIGNIYSEPLTFYCADWNRCGSICEEQCAACKKTDNFESPNKEEVL